MKQKFKHWFFRNHVTITAILIVIILSLHAFDPEFATSEFLISGIGGILAISYFCFQHSLDEKRFARELFTDFNKRYNRLNDRLYDIAVCIAPELEPKEKKTLVDYFNLCAEEWLYFDDGIIPPKVWKSWNNGMRQYYRIERIQNFWSEELKTGSYYGFGEASLQ